jgi:hypothetical protein
MKEEMNLDDGRKQNDELLRREILRVLFHAREGPTAWLRGDSVMRIVRSGLAADVEIRDESHAVGLCRDLVNRGLIVQEFLPQRAWEPFGLQFVRYRISDKGTDLHLEKIPPDPQVADDRIVRD